MPEPCNWI
uniref:Uncharacterized protein n=1 Tax=Anguilla anguilla TaxID=7936 RepID=A0A0E9SER9_ANGAN